MSLFNFWSKKEKVDIPFLEVDMHSHVLPGIDDGADTLEDSLELLSQLSALGYKKMIATPHIMGDFYKNTPEIIHKKLETVREVLMQRQVNISLEAAAEYYLDEWFMEKLNKEEPLLTFGDNYLLFETSYINESSYFAEAVFKLKSLGYKPVLAHPERYTYLYSGFEKFEELYAKGVLFQINLNSLAGYYSKAAQKFSTMLIDKQMVQFAGTDCHGIRHIEALKKARATKHYKNLANSNLLNNQLL